MSEHVRWQPRSVREGLRKPLEPAQGIPESLRGHLENWVEETLSTYLSRDGESPILYALRFDLEVSPFADAHDVVDTVTSRMQKDHQFAWDVVDDLVSREGDGHGLGEILDVVAHEFQVAPDGMSLARRVPDEVAAAFEEVTSAPDYASELLSSAFTKVYGRRPEARSGWEEATKAVENLLKPVVSPKDRAATLTKMARALRDKPDKWVAKLRVDDGEDPVPAFARALEFVGYAPGRHGAEEAVDLVAARSAVMQAITVAQWLRDGVLTRRETVEAEAPNRSATEEPR